MPENMVRVGLGIRSRKVREELEEVVSSLEGFSIQKSDEPSSCDLLILEIGSDLEKEFELINSIRTSGTTGEVFLTSSRIEPDVLLWALRAGAKEFFPQPIKDKEVRNALLKFKERKEAVTSGEGKRKKGKIIAVVGSKGGVGTTTVAVNLAISLMELKSIQSVVLIDMNLPFGGIPVFLDLKSAFNWGEIVRNISRVDATYLMSILSKHPSGVYVLPPPTELEENVATPEIIEGLLSLMRTVFDFIVIDCGQTFDDISQKILEMSDTVLLISILSLPSLINVKRLLKTFQKMGYPPAENTKIVVNRYDKKAVISPEEAERSISKKIFWSIPYDPFTTTSALNQGKTLSAVARKAEISKNLRELASIFLEKKEEGKKRKAAWAAFWGLSL